MRSRARVSRTNVVEAVVAFLVLVMGLVVIQGSWKLGSGWTTDGPGAGYFPFYIGLILCISGARNDVPGTVRQEEEHRDLRRQ